MVFGASGNGPRGTQREGSREQLVTSTVINPPQDSRTLKVGMHTSKYLESTQLMTSQGMHETPGRSPSTQSGNATNANVLLLATTSPQHRSS